MINKHTVKKKFLIELEKKMIWRKLDLDINYSCYTININKKIIKLDELKKFKAYFTFLKINSNLH